MWHRERWAGAVIRVAGAGLLVLAAGAARLLVMREGAPPAPQTALDLLLAVAAFACASAGSAMLVLGRHLFDEVEVSERWRTIPRARTSSRG